LAAALAFAVLLLPDPSQNAYAQERESLLSWRSEDGKNSLRSIGRISYDFADYHNDAKNLGTGNQVTAARLGMRGTLNRDWGFFFQYDFKGRFSGDRESQLRYAVLSYSGLERFVFAVGQTGEPFGLRAFRSVGIATFMESGLPFAFAPPTHLGATVSYRGTGWGIHGGLFGKTVGNNNHDEGRGGSVRLFAAPVNTAERVVHLGAALAYRDPDSDSVRIRARPESAVTDVRLVDTGTISRVKDTHTLGLETAVVYGSLSIQGEQMFYAVKRDLGVSDYVFRGNYLSVSYFITGESRRYNDATGVFRSVRIKNKTTGAFEMALRYSTINLNDGSQQGGSEADITLGLNWYLTPNFRAMFNRIWVASERQGVRDNPRIAQVRFQLDF